MLLPGAFATMAPDWLRVLRSEADCPPLRARVPLITAVEVGDNTRAVGSVIGSVEPDFLDKIALSGIFSGGYALLKKEHSPESGACTGWLLNGDVTTSLDRVAAALHAAGLAGAWRQEQLAVCDARGVRVGAVERAAVRPLGIATLGVHLAGQSPDGRFWVQQRAFDKPNDPGKWDTLMGGMVSSSDTVETALARETWEEAGLHIADLKGLRYGGRLTTRRPASDGGCAGYVVENIDWYVCTVPDGVKPINQDGEVAQFSLMNAAQLLEALRGGAFTLEAAMILANVLGFVS
jgi:8-oxo-dGTP pyrophosphatase MutT (NUDIX family)